MNPVKKPQPLTQRKRVTMTPAAVRVLEAAGRLFYANGIHAVGVDRIAAEAGVTKKTLYDRFGSKEQLVVEYLAERDERWQAFLAARWDAVPKEPTARVLAVFDASHAWATEVGSRGCSMINAHAEINDPAHPAYPVLVGQKAWMLDLFTGLAEEWAPGRGAELGRTLLLLHEGALVAHGMKMFAEPVLHAREQARAVLAVAGGAG
ncbi:TetR/AcrR family transcriptional regulator [Streptomyces sp. NPDC051561]|uniref:TetR/AcrR family transcriptional regulator n=1 Tax=Streptomyces sp. NPDC051561 TaxID=3365658 RepID=UPI003788D7D0